MKLTSDAMKDIAEYQLYQAKGLKFYNRYII